MPTIAGIAHPEPAGFPFVYPQPQSLCLPNSAYLEPVGFAAAQLGAPGPDLRQGFGAKAMQVAQHLALQAPWQSTGATETT